MNYLDIFDNAKVWIKYVHFLNKKYYKNDFLEVGAGIGSFTDNYKERIKNIFLTEVDKNNLSILKDKYKNNLNIKFLDKEVGDIEEQFNTIAHFNVLEHIKEDKKEIYNCLNKINQNGYLVILVPAHNKLYSKLDKDVGETMSSSQSADESESDLETGSHRYECRNCGYVYDPKEGLKKYQISARCYFVIHIN